MCYPWYLEVVSNAEEEGWVARSRDQLAVAGQAGRGRLKLSSPRAARGTVKPTTVRATTG